MRGQAALLHGYYTLQASVRNRCNMGRCAQDFLHWQLRMCFSTSSYLHMSQHRTSGPRKTGVLEIKWVYEFLFYLICSSLNKLSLERKGAKKMKVPITQALTDKVGCSVSYLKVIAQTEGVGHALLSSSKKTHTYSPSKSQRRERGEKTVTCPVPNKLRRF